MRCIFSLGVPGDTFKPLSVGQFDGRGNDASAESEDYSMTLSVNWQLPNAISSGLGIEDHYVPRDPLDFLEGPSLSYEGDCGPIHYLDETPEHFEHEMPLDGRLDDSYIQPKFDFC